MPEAVYDPNVDHDGKHSQADTPNDVARGGARAKHSEANTPSEEARGGARGQQLVRLELVPSRFEQWPSYLEEAAVTLEDLANWQIWRLSFEEAAIALEDIAETAKIEGWHLKKLAVALKRRTDCHKGSLPC